MRRTSHGRIKFFADFTDQPMALKLSRQLITECSGKAMRVVCETTSSEGLGQSGRAEGVSSINHVVSFKLSPHGTFHFFSAFVRFAVSTADFRTSMPSNSLQRKQASTQ